MPQKKFWRWKNQADDPKRELFLHGEIAESTWWGDEVTPNQFRDELNEGTGPVTVYINSPGGDCIAASQIYTMLTEYRGKVTVLIDGLAASAASVIAMAGDEVIMAPTALMMIHNPSTMAWGDKAEMEKVIEVLESFKASIINAYETKTGLSRAKLSRLMDEETWMDATQAVSLGFVDKILSREEMNVPADNYIGNMLFSRHTVAACVNKAIQAMIEAQEDEDQEEPKPTEGTTPAEPEGKPEGEKDADLNPDTPADDKKIVNPETPVADILARLELIKKFM